MSPPRAPPELIDDAVAEILLRIPPDEPADLFRASLVCKPWLRVASDPAFLRRYRAFHRGAPLLGFFYYAACPSYSPLFVPTAASPLTRPAYDDHDWMHWPVLHDCRHGRVLYRNSATNFVVWDPVTGYREELPTLDIPYSSYSAVVLCAVHVAGCNHRDCHGGPFLVFCVGCIYLEETIRVSLYSSEARMWDTPDSTHLDGTYMFDVTRAALIGDGIYCSLLGSRILKYDLVSHCFSLIDMPCKYGKCPILMQNEDGSLGLAGVSVRGSRLYVWSRMVNPEGVTGWVQQRAIELKILRKFKAFGFAEGVGVFIMSTKVGVFTYELKSGRVREVSGPIHYYCTFSPFISFFTPDYACSKLPSLAETS